MEYLDYASQDLWESYSNFESPIDINLSQIENKPLKQQPLTFAFTPGDRITKKIQSNGDQFLVAGKLVVGKQKYQLQRLHFHDGSEHTINGRRLDGEIHLVFQGENNSNLVLAILCQVDKEHAEKLPLTAIYNEQAHGEDLNLLLPANLSHVTYVGSLTTPPLKSDITWIVLTESHFISPDSKEALHNDYPDSHREIQPLNGRKPIYYE